MHIPSVTTDKLELLTFRQALEAANTPSGDYDIEKFERCIQAEAVKAQINPDIYFILTNNCQQWRGALISICMGIAKR